jgi:hypothetical protein
MRDFFVKIRSNSLWKQPGRMLGGYHGSAVDSPGKQNTRSKYSSILHSNVPVTAAVMPIAFYGQNLHHYPLEGGYYNRAIEYPGKYSSRVKLSIVHQAVPSSASVAVYALASTGGFYNRSTDSPGKYSSRVKYSSLGLVAPSVHASTQRASSQAATSSTGHAAVSQAQIDAVKQQYVAPHNAALVPALPPLVLFLHRNALPAVACSGVPTSRAGTVALTRAFSRQVFRRLLSA